mmetsp:Transcript_49466/g.114305  ORF Transcript_49466/g.114305 Transcript_49466/m.114305 type:complete len:229 (-) Transcript_49466:2311-2997(-)
MVATWLHGVERREAILVGQRDRSAHGCELHGQLNATTKGSDVERSVAALRLRSVKVGRVLSQHLDEAREGEFSGRGLCRPVERSLLGDRLPLLMRDHGALGKEVKHGLPLAVLQGGVGAMFKQHWEHLGSVRRLLGASVQRRVPVEVEQIAPVRLRVPLHQLAALDEERKHGGLATGGARRVQRSEPTHSLMQHRVCAVGHQAAHDIQVPERACPVQRRLGVWIEHVH